MGAFVFLCVYDTAATCGQYLALSKAWRSCWTLFLSSGTSTESGKQIRTDERVCYRFVTGNLLFT